MKPFKPKKRFVPTAEQEEKTLKQGKRGCVFSFCQDVYTGEWLNDLKNGLGTEYKNISGTKYVGNWKLGKPEGYGVSFEWNRETNRFDQSYVGYWKNGKKHGFGISFCKTRVKYDGQWSQGFKEGLGLMYYDNGDIYEGFWRRNLTHGLGIFLLANGNKYEGIFEDGIANGKGRFYYYDSGKIYEGQWKNGLPVCGKISDYQTDKAPEPSTHPIPTIRLVDSERVLMESEKAYQDQKLELKLFPKTEMQDSPENDTLLSQ